MGTNWQLREYTVKSGEMGDWLAEWREKIVPLRERFGFRVLGAWTVEGADQFVWILGHDGESWEDADRAYYDSAERKAITPDPARHLARAATRLMREAH